MGRLGPCLWALLVFLGASFAGSWGEICLNWTKGAASPAGAFECPAKLDGADAFCCGPCHAPYCCSSTEARLNQDRCPSGDQLLVSSVPPATADSLYPYIGLGLTVAIPSVCIAYVIYRQICLPLWACIRGRPQVREQHMVPSRVSFQNPSPTFVYNVASRLRGHNPPPLYHACTAVPLTNFPPDNQDSPPYSWTDMRAQPSQADSGMAGDEVASSSAAAVLDMAASGDTPAQRQTNTQPAQSKGVSRCLSPWDRVKKMKTKNEEKKCAFRMKKTSLL